MNFVLLKRLCNALPLGGSPNCLTSSGRSRGSGSDLCSGVGSGSGSDSGNVMVVVVLAV